MEPNNHRELSLLRILLVEDNEHDRVAFRRAIKKARLKYEIKECVRGEEALETLRVNTSQFDIIVSDYMLPGMNGLELCKMLIKTKVPAPIIIITGSGSEEVAVEAIKAGVDDYIVKDPGRGYLKLLPIVIPEVVRKYGNKLARKEAEEALRKSETNLSLSQKVAHLGNWEWNIISGNRTWSDELYRILGYEPHAIEASMEAIMERIHPDDRELVTIIANESMDGDEMEKTFEHRIIQPNGTIRYIQGRWWLQKNKEGKPTKWFGTLLDITERKHAENSLKKSENKLNALINATMDIAFLAESDGTLLAVNDALAFNFNRKKEELIGRSMYEFMTTEIAESRRTVLQKIVASKKPFQGEDKRAGKYFANSIYPVFDDDGNVKQIAVFAKDITSRIQTENKLKESEEKYRSLSQNIPGIVYRVFIRENYRMEFFNDMLETMTGFKANELINGEVCSIEPNIHMEDRSSVIASVNKAIKENTYFDLEYRYNHKNGETKWFKEHGRPIHGEDGKPLYIEGVIFDITDRKKMEDEIRQSSKMESIGTLAGGVAHDFNNLLYMIMGNTELALEDIPEWNPVHETLEEIKSASLRAAGIVKQLLNFSRKTDQDFRPIGAVTVLKDALKFLRSTIPSTVKIQTNLPDDDVPIIGDPIQINQIIMNLCTNASQVMQDTGGTIEIDVETIVLNEEDCEDYTNLSAGNHIKITINDSGPGIAPDIIDKIFDPYFTTKKFGAGSGMGLAVVHGIVINHNGTIYVDNNPGQGATFNILFPITDELPESKSHIKDDIIHGSETILFVDDEKSIANMTGKILERLGYQIEKQLNPVEAFELFTAKSDSFDLVITDMTMPQMTGINLAEKLKEIRPDIPVIICTGHSAVIDEEKAKQLGIDGFVMKPVSKLKIAKAIRDVLDK